MWVVRELGRLLIRIAVAVVIAGLVAGLTALVSGGDALRTFKIMLLLLGCLMLLLAAGSGRTSAAARRVNWPITRLGLRPSTLAQAEGPQLTAGAVFALGGLVLIALGVFA